MTASSIGVFGRYRLLRLLGRGGMGTVYLAFDPVLNRRVALKILYRQTPEIVARFLQEARSQAGVEHEAICRVYEAGEEDAGPYIAMQFVDGETLRDAAPKMTLEQRVRVLEQVSGALHEAHRSGLIHRDLKPENVMVERRDDGSLHPYVLDFGLARLAEGEGLTQGSAVVGTPAYMSPEQARGGITVDRRSDVYSLGATLYEALAGVPPFSGASSIQILIQVVEMEPKPLRQRVPEVPADLATIVAKCLEKDPSRRYDSARSLAEDLARFRNGEPIAARPASVLYRLGKRAKKNRLVVGVGAAGSIAALVLLVLFVQARVTAAERTRLAQRFGQQVEQLEAVLRHAAMLPKHDVTPERRFVAERLKRLEAELPSLGRTARGPGDWALGKGYLALHDVDAARLHLLRAWEAGFRGPEVATALGQTFGALYLRGLSETRRLGTHELREARRKEVERDFREPARRYLEAAKGAEFAAPELVEGLLAFYDQRYDLARRKAEAARRTAPWLFEAERLVAETFLAEGAEKLARGDFPGADGDLAAAGKSFAMAIDLARSDELAYRGACVRETLVMEAVSVRGGSEEDAFRAAVGACNAARAVNPESVEAITLLASVYEKLARLELARGESPEGPAREAIRVAKEALKKDPNATEPLNVLGAGTLSIGDHQVVNFIDPRATYREAIEAFTRVLQLDPGSFSAYRNIGHALEGIGEYELAKDLDPTAALRSAVASLERAVRRSPAVSSVHNNLAVTYQTLAEYELKSGRDPRPSLEKALHSTRNAVERNPGSAFFENNRGTSLYTYAQYEERQGRDPTRYWDEAEAAYREALRKKPDNGPSEHNLGELTLARARREARLGRDPGPSLLAARAALEHALGLNPEFAPSLVVLGQVETLAARWALSRGADPEPSLVRAERALETARRGAPDDIRPLVGLAAVGLVRVEKPRSLTRDSAFREALRLVDQALRLQPKDAEALAVRGALLASRKDAASAREAVASFELAFQRDPSLRGDYGPAADSARRLAGP